MSKRIRISTTQDKLKTISIVVLLTALFCFSVGALDLDIQKFFGRLGNTADVLKRFMTVDFKNILPILNGMLTSIMLAVSALALGVIMALILSFLAAENIAPSKTLSLIIKGGTAIVRAVPALVWILMVVASVGFGNTGGMIGLIFPTVGYLIKSFTASIEDLGYEAIEAIKMTGANRLIIMEKALLPNLIRPFMSWTTMRLEGNIGESINLGMVGVGGIGAVLMKALGKFDYGSVTASILVIVGTLIVVELTISRLKRNV